METSKFILTPLITGLLLLIDRYNWNTVSQTITGRTEKMQTIIKYLYWGFALILIRLLWAYIFIDEDLLGAWVRGLMLELILWGCAVKALVAVLFIFNGALRYAGKLINENAVKIGRVKNMEGTKGAGFSLRASLLILVLPLSILLSIILPGSQHYLPGLMNQITGELPKFFSGISRISGIGAGLFLIPRLGIKGKKVRQKAESGCSAKK